jgi:hypothetical protein
VSTLEKIAVWIGVTALAWFAIFGAIAAAIWLAYLVSGSLFGWLM